jgi:hypothetical protein
VPDLLLSKVYGLWAGAEICHAKSRFDKDLWALRVKFARIHLICKDIIFFLEKNLLESYKFLMQIAAFEMMSYLIKIDVQKSPKNFATPR